MRNQASLSTIAARSPIELGREEAPLYVFRVGKLVVIPIGLIFTAAAAFLVWFAYDRATSPELTSSEATMACALLLSVAALIIWLVLTVVRQRLEEYADGWFRQVSAFGSRLFHLDDVHEIRQSYTDWSKPDVSGPFSEAADEELREVLGNDSKQSLVVLDTYGKKLATTSTTFPRSANRYLTHRFVHAMWENRGLKGMDRDIPTPSEGTGFWDRYGVWITVFGGMVLAGFARYVVEMFV